MSAAALRGRCLVLGEYAFQAHRGGLEEVPENTVEGMLYAWQFSAAVPEVDVRTLADGRLVCLHDDTLARTTNAPRAIRQVPLRRLTFEEVREVDAGMKRGRRFRGCRVPQLGEVLELMRGREHRRLYIEPKDADYGAILELVERLEIERQVLFVHEDEGECLKLREALPQAGSMTWCGGSPQEIRDRFERLRGIHFRGLTQVQLHLPIGGETGVPVPGLPERFIADALEQARAAGVDLQVKPLGIDRRVLRWLLDLGVRWFVTDAPLRFVAAMSAVFEPFGFDGPEGFAGLPPAPRLTDRPASAARSPGSPR